MANFPVLHVRTREMPGSLHARQLRRTGEIPAVLYGHGASEPVALRADEFRALVKPAQYGSLVVMLTTEQGTPFTALVKAVQVHPLQQGVLHVDLQRVSMEDRIQVSVPMVLQGEPADALRAGGVLEQMVRALARCRASDVPEEITFDISQLEIGDVIHAGQLALPAGAELLSPPDEVIALILTPTVPAQEQMVTITEQISGPQLTGDRQKSTDVAEMEEERRRAA